MFGHIDYFTLLKVCVSLYCCVRPCSPLLTVRGEMVVRLSQYQWKEQQKSVGWCFLFCFAFLVLW